MKKIIPIVLMLLSNFVYSQDLDIISDSVFSLTVKERTQHNIQSEIFMSQSLCEAARIQAEYILRTGTPTHKNPNSSLQSVDDRVKKFGYRGGANENITYLHYNNESDDSLSKRAINNFMNSLGHRVTLLCGDEVNSNYKTAYGQCILFDSQRKKIIVVQVFVTCIWDSDLLIE